MCLHRMFVFQVTIRVNNIGPGVKSLESSLCLNVFSGQQTWDIARSLILVPGLYSVIDEKCTTEKARSFPNYITHPL